MFYTFRYVCTLEVIMSEIAKFCLKPEHEEILKKRPRAPWIDDVPEGDHITPYPTYEVGKLFHLFDEAYEILFLRSCQKRI